MSTFLDTLVDIESRYDELEQLMADPTVTADHLRLQEIGRERAELDGVVTAFRQLRDTEAAIEETETLAADPEMADLAAEELRTLRDRQQTLLGRVRSLLIPKDPNDDKNVIVEIRAGTGGDEAALFAADLFRMYTRFAERNRWKTEILSATETDGGGFREIIFEVRGKGAFSHLRYESGVHRVQRVPATERQGRIHTSTASVAVLPEAEEVDIQVNDNDLRVDVYRSRLYEMEQQRLSQERGDARRSQIGSGDRSEKIRTYNFPQDRITDHRVNLSLSNIPGVLDGQIDTLVTELRNADEAERLREAGLEEQSAAAD